MRWLAVGLALAAACSSKSSSESNRTPERTPEPPAPRQVDPPAAAGALAGNLARDGDLLWATWIEPAGERETSGSTRRGPHRVRIARFAGGAWGEPATIAEGDDVFANWADVPSVVRGGDGALVAHWAKRSGKAAYAYDVALARSEDDGATWSPIGLAHDDGTTTEHGFVSLVPDADGVRAFWLDGREMAGGAHGGHGSGPMTLRTALIGAAVTAGEVVDERVCDCCGTAAATAGGDPIVVYRDRSPDEVRDVWFARRAGDGWSAPAPVHEDGWRVPGCPVNGPAIAVDGERLAVAWYTYANERGSVRVAFADGARFAAPIEVDGPRGRSTPIGRVGIAPVAPGEAVVSWMASDREDATVLLRRVTAGGLVGEPVPVARSRASREAGFPRLARVGDAVGVLWTEAGDASRLRFRLLPLAAIPPATSKPAPPEPGEGALLALGAAAPGYEVDRLDGTRGALSEGTAGAVALVNVWATWCEPCRHELPELAALQRRYADAGLRVVAVSVDRERAADDIAAFAKRRELPFSVWHDSEDRSSRAFGIGALPASFLFDRSGKLVWRRAGAIPQGDEAVRAAIEAALAR